MSEKWAGELPTAAAAALPISRTQAHVRRLMGAFLAARNLVFTVPAFSPVQLRRARLADAVNASCSGEWSVTGAEPRRKRTAE